MTKKNSKTDFIGCFIFQLLGFGAVGFGITNAHEQYEKEHVNSKPLIQQYRDNAIREETLKAMRHYLENYKKND